MIIFNKIALSFVVFFSFSIIINTYLGEKDRVQSDVIYFVMNGFAYIVSALEVENEKRHIDTTEVWSGLK